MLPRDHWRRHHDRLDPVVDNREIAIGLSTLEFPWDTLQALSFALFRTYAVPSIGVLLHDTGEFTERVQKRYDDTGLILEEILEHGLDDGQGRGRAALRRMNQMHGRYDIPNEDFRYVLATFVVMPKRWMERWGYRPMTEHEVTATTHYYLELGRHMGIKDLPADFDGFDRLLDEYEAAHFAYDARSRRVANSTLDLMTTFPPNSYLPAWLMKRFAYSLMDEPLRVAFGYPECFAWEKRLFHTGLRLRQRWLRLMPARRRPKWARDFGYYRSYPGGYLLERLGTFPGARVARPEAAPSGCPVSTGPAVPPVTAEAS